MTTMALSSNYNYLLLAFAIIVILGFITYQLRAITRQAKPQKTLSTTTSSQEEAPAFFENIVIRAGFTPDVVLHVAASISQASEHRLAKAIVSEAQKRKLPINAVQDFKLHTGYGMTGNVDGRIIAVGSYTLMQELGINTLLSPEKAKELQKDGTSVIYISINSYLAGIITIVKQLHAS
jgi:Cu+-exporting ATPase